MFFMALDGCFFSNSHFRSFMHVNHCDPLEAVKIHDEIKSLQSVAVHWGTFKLGREVVY